MVPVGEKKSAFVSADLSDAAVRHPDHVDRFAFEVKYFYFCNAGHIELLLSIGQAVDFGMNSDLFD